MLQWDDLKFFIASARGGTFTEAARLLGADVATVSRRVIRLETAMKATLFVRSASGLKLTAIGRQTLEDCALVETSINRVQAPVGQSQIAGAVRISASEGFGVSILARALPDLRKARPELTIELAANAGFLSATTREVDIAVTLGAPNDVRLVVEPLTEYHLGLFSTPKYLKAFGTPKRVEDLMGHTIVGYVDDQIYTPELRYLDEVYPKLKTALSSTSIQAQYAILASGGGIGVLPKFLAGKLTPVLPESVNLKRTFWISTHKNVFDTARIKVVRNWMKEVVRDAPTLPS